MSKAANRKNTADILKEQKEDRKRFFAARRQQASNTGSPVVGNVATGLNFSLGDFDITTGNTSGLSPNGGVMSGPIAFNSKVVSITSDKLTIASILELPTSKRIVTFKLLTHQDEKNIDAELKAMRKISKGTGIDPEITTRLKSSIISVDGNNDRASVNNFIDNEFL